MPECCKYESLVLAVAHDEFRDAGINGLMRLINSDSVIYDIKGLFDKNDVDGRL